MGKILVVEDNEFNLELVTDLLEAGGHTVLSAGDAATGIELARTEKPDLILMDISLPGMDGLTATRQLKEESLTQDIPVMALTAHAMKADLVAAEEAGCSGYLSKPIDTRAFLSQVEVYFREDG